MNVHKNIQFMIRVLHISNFSAMALDDVISAATIRQHLEFIFFNNHRGTALNLL